MPRRKPTIFRDELLGLLLDVATTTRQARQIIKRSQQALASPVSDGLVSLRIGCPHCCDANQHPMDLREKITDSDCNACVYPGRRGYQFQCCRRAFAGVLYSDVSGTVTLHRYYVDLWPPLAAKDRAWFTGHIDWGRAVIATGGKRATPERIAAYLDTLYPEAS